MKNFSEGDIKLFKNLPFSYFSTPTYLKFAGSVFYRDKEPVLVWQDLFFPHDFPPIFLPGKKENWINCSVALATEKDMEKIKKEGIEIKIQKPIGTEFLYVDIGGELAGFAWGVEHPNGNWTGLHLKVNYKYKGLSRFLHNERAKLFINKKLFTLETGSHESGITQYKLELKPVLQKQYYYLLTGGQLI